MFNSRLGLSFGPPFPQAFVQNPPSVGASTPQEAHDTGPFLFESEGVSQGSELFELGIVHVGKGSGSAPRIDHNGEGTEDVNNSSQMLDIGEYGRDESMEVFGILVPQHEDDPVVYTQTDPVLGRPPSPLLTPELTPTRSVSSPASSKSCVTPSPLDTRSCLPHETEKQEEEEKNNADAPHDGLDGASFREKDIGGDYKGSNELENSKYLNSSYQAGPFVKMDTSSEALAPSTRYNPENRSSPAGPSTKTSPPHASATIIPLSGPAFSAPLRSRQAALVAADRLQATFQEEDDELHDVGIGLRSKRRQEDEYIPEPRQSKRSRTAWRAPEQLAAEEGSNAEDSNLNDVSTRRAKIEPRPRNRCNKCNKTFRRRSDLERHLETAAAHRNMDGWECDACNKTLSRQDALQRHQKQSCAGKWIG